MMMALLKKLVLLLMVIYDNSLSTVSGDIDNEKLSSIYANLLGFDFDLEYVTKEYLKVCPQLERCKDGDASFSDIITESQPYQLPIHCPTCSCTQDCVINNECCPNVIYGYLQYDCLSSVKRRGKSWHNETSFYMIASCPQSWLARNNLSEQNGSAIPVTSYTTGLTYRTKEFAQCNGDDHSLVIWNTSYHCSERTEDGWDFLIINSLEELLQNLEKGNCEIRLSVTNPKVPRQAVCNGELYFKEKRLIKPKELVDKCNMTGLWGKFDPLIDIACRRLSLTFGNYKNVFCYMCNLGLSIKYHLKKPTIGTCDDTFSETEIENACITGEKSTYYLPYKNVFCLLCSKRFYPFTFASRGLHETWILVENTNENIVAKIIGRLFRTENSCKTMSHSNDSAYYETSIHEVIRFDREEYSCSIPLNIQTENYLRNGSDTSDCGSNNTLKVTNRISGQFYNCLDLLEREHIAQNFANADTSHEKEEILLQYILHTYLCEDSVKMNNICESYNTDKMNPYTLLSNKTGKYLSCLICKMGDAHTENNYYLRTTGFDILIRITCPTLLQAGLFLDTFSMLGVTLDNGCSLWFYPTGVRDPHFFRILGLIGTDECIDFPWIDKTTCVTLEGSYYFGSYRKLFSVSNTDWKALLQVKKRERTSYLSECPEAFALSAMNINDSCRETFCSEGHVLVNDECRNEYETYVNVVYELVFHLVVTKLEKRTALVIDASTDQAIILHLAVINIVDVCDSVHDIIRHQMNKNISFSFKECVVKTDTICSENSITELVIGSHIEINIKTMIHFTKELSLVEEKLIHSLTNAPGSYFVSDSGVTLTHQYPMRAIHKQLCFKLSYDFDSMFISKQIRVNKLLTCPQIQLFEYEYRFDNESNTLQLLTTEVQIEIYSIKDGHVRVCLEDFNASFKNVLKLSSLQRLYKVFDNVCTILSLLFMFITFVTYLIFPSLRTVPGLNNMSLIFSLFFAQATLKFGLWQPTNMVICSVFGILIHFFWLATFCSMNVCSFHMYRVFSSNALSLHTFTRKTSVFYLLYTYLIPVLIILLTVVVHLALSVWQDFGYGKTICFLSDYITIIVSFICPCVFVFLLNILFFIKTFLSMRRTLSNPRLRRSSERHDVFVYLRLSTLLGIAWPLLIVDAFFTMSVFSFIALTFNTLQGLFVFFSFVCNRRVLHLYLAYLFGNDIDSNTKAFKQTKENAGVQVVDDCK